MKKKTLSVSKVVICHEIESFTEEVPLKFKNDVIFWFLQITLKIGLCYRNTTDWPYWSHQNIISAANFNFLNVLTINHHLTALKERSMKSQHRWKNLITIIWIWKRILFKESFFYNVFHYTVDGKLLYIARFF